MWAQLAARAGKRLRAATHDGAITLHGNKRSSDVGVPGEVKVQLGNAAVLGAPVADITNGGSRSAGAAVPHFVALGQEALVIGRVDHGRVDRIISRDNPVIHILAGGTSTDVGVVNRSAGERLDVGVKNHHRHVVLGIVLVKVVRDHACSRAAGAKPGHAHGLVTHTSTVAGSHAMAPAVVPRDATRTTEAVDLSVGVLRGDHGSHCQAGNNGEEENSRG